MTAPTAVLDAAHVLGMKADEIVSVEDGVATTQDGHWYKIEDGKVVDTSVPDRDRALGQAVDLGPTPYDLAPSPADVELSDAQLLALARERGFELAEPDETPAEPEAKAKPARGGRGKPALADAEPSAE